MAEITIGYVSGIIALFVFLVQFLVPSLFAFITSGILRDQETAATWTAITPLLQQSHWTKILKSDVSRSESVHKPIALAIYATTGVVVLTAIAGVVTPLGLYDSFEESSARAAQFNYIKDSSPFSTALTPRDNQSFTRTCRNGTIPYPCPYTDTIMMLAKNSSNGIDLVDYPYGYDVMVPQIFRDIYASGTVGPTTISNFFDIEWRQIRQTTTNGLNNGSQYTIGYFRPIKSLILDDDNIQLVEGLVLDNKNAGIGFRNHTVPADAGHGMSWKEDLLFVEPETVCVDTNLALEFELNTESIDYTADNYTDYSTISKLFLVDNGGFSQLEQVSPAFDRDAQKDPQLTARAHRAAWLNNVYTMFMLNISNPVDPRRGFVTFSRPNSTRGKRYQLPTNSHPLSSIGYLSVTNSYNSFLEIFDSVGNPGTIRSLNDVGNGDLAFSDPRAECAGVPLVISNVTGNFYDTRRVISNISNIYIGCGLMHGAAQKRNPGTYFAVDNSGVWSIPLYSCASTVKAKVKEVNFQLNGSSSLRNLQVLSSKDKVYSEESNVPLWGVENSGLGISAISSIWGLIDSAYENFPNVSTVCKSELYLPGVSSTLGHGFSALTGLDSNLPGYDFPGISMETVFTVTDPGSDLEYTDYTGMKDLEMAMKWQDLSSSASSAGGIINHIWTDIAANAVVGSKGSLGPRNAGLSNETVPILVNPMVRKIKYRLLYAIPAFILCGVLALIAIATILSALSGRSSLKMTEKRLHQTSVGRLLTTVLYPQQSDLVLSSKQWNKANGSTKIDLSIDGVRRAFNTSDNGSTG